MKYINVDNKKIRINNIFCIGLNYDKHIQEMGNKKNNDLTVFLKPNNSINLKEKLFLDKSFSQNYHYEIEIIILIGKNANNITIDKSIKYISAYSVGIDITARDIQNNLKDKRMPWLKSKGFKNAACLANFIPASNIKNNENINFELKINNKIVQKDNSKNMIFSINEIVSNLSKTYGLQKGDIIFTGTPSGVGKLNHLDKLTLNLDDLIKANFNVILNN